MAKNVNTATPIKVEHHAEEQFMGIRFIAPFAGMFKEIDKVKKELERWFKAQGIQPAGPPILRYYVIDMRGKMELEYALPVSAPLAGDDRVKPSTLPAGRYTRLIYSGGGLQGNKTLIEGSRALGLEFDRWDTEAGDNFRARYERFLTDPKVEPRKTKWDIEVAIKLVDE